VPDDVRQAGSLTPRKAGRWRTSGSVVLQQWEPGRDISDHYGVQVAVDTTTQTLPTDDPIGAVDITLALYTGLQTTSGPRDDEARFWSSARAVRVTGRSPHLANGTRARCYK
jgi:hypothetical protein